MRPRIFVSIASYRDTECQWTIKDLFIKAAHPDRVFVGLCDQVVPGDDGDCFVEPCPRPDQIRRIDVHAKDSKGACWARHQVQTLWRGEEYYLQIDSHMRFVEGWDEQLLAMLAGCDSPKPLLSAYPPSYIPPDQLLPPTVVTIIPKAFEVNGVLMFTSTAAPVTDPPAPLHRNPFIAAGLLFAKSDIIREVPYDPYLYFQGEEIALAARLWTFGWDVFAPNTGIVWHDYTKRPDRHRHWHDSTDWGEINKLSFHRVRHLLGMQISQDPEVVRDMELYGLGTSRKLSDYEAFAGIDFGCRLIDGIPKTLPEDDPDAEWPRKARRNVFSHIWKLNGWKNPESRSGSGSTLQATKVIRAKLPKLLRAFKCDILVDAGCGDLNWMQCLSSSLRMYVGIDVVEGLIAELRSRFADRGNHLFEVRDLVTQDLPPGDAILCRDVLTHLPPAQVVAALRRFRASGARHLITTTHPGATNHWVDVGGWCPYDLMKPPFNLPQPRALLSEGLPRSAKSLGVWLCSDLPAA